MPLTVAVRCNATPSPSGRLLVLFVGGAWAFVRTYQTWRNRGGWWIWQGAGWFLLVLMLVVLSMTVPPALLS